MSAAILQISGGLLESVGQLAVLAGTLVLVLALVALGSFAYKSLRGDGIEWPDDREPDEDDSVQRSEDDEEWKYY
jgi:hypothetical protein